MAELLKGAFEVEGTQIQYSLSKNGEGEFALRTYYFGEVSRIFSIKQSVVQGDFLVLPLKAALQKSNVSFSVEGEQVKIVEHTVDAYGDLTGGVGFSGTLSLAETIEKYTLQGYFDLIKSSLPIRAFLKEQGFNIEVEPKTQAVGK